MLISFILGMGCIPQWPYTEYQGKLIAGDLLGSWSENYQDLFKVLITKVNKSKLSVQFISKVDAEFFNFQLSNFTETSFTAYFPLLEETLDLKKVGDLRANLTSSDCFSGSAHYEITACLGNRDFYLQIHAHDGRTLLEIKGGIAESNPPELEVPRRLSLSEAVQRAFEKNFSSQIEYEQSVRVGYAALAAKLNLLPHFRFFNAAGIITGAAPVLLVSLGDWLPFLFPNRWMQASQMNEQAKAAEMAFAIMQANLATEVRALSYSSIHDEKRLSLLLSIREEVNQDSKRFEPIADLPGFEALQRAHTLLTGVKEGIDPLINEVKISLGSGNAALAEVLGFWNPRAVAGIEDESIYPELEQPGYSIEPAKIAEVAYSLSLERRQLEYLETAALSKKLELAFNWLDPTGNPQTAFGANLVPQELSAQAEINIIQLSKQKARQKFNQLAFALGRQIESTENGYREAKEVLFLVRQSLEDYRKELNSVPLAEKSNSEIEIIVGHLVPIYKDVVNWSLYIEEMKEKWDLTHARMERLLLTDLFKQLRPDKSAGQECRTKVIDTCRGTSIL